MKMPVHMFIALGNILAGQFKKESEAQQKQQEEAASSLPNLRQFADISNFGNIASSIGNGISLPNL